MSLGEVRKRKQGDDTRMKLKVLWWRIGTMFLGIAAVMKCDLSPSLTCCQQSLSLLDASPSGLYCGVKWHTQYNDIMPRIYLTGDYQNSHTQRTTHSWDQITGISLLVGCSSGCISQFT